MRATMGNNLRNIRHRMRLLAVSTVALAAVLSLVSFLSSVAYADPLGAQELLSEQQPTQQETETDELQKVQLINGTAQSTTASDINNQRTKLTWTPTGVNDIQDTYDVRVTRTPDIDSNGQLSGEVVSTGDNLAVAEFDVSTLSEGAYFWQVGSCIVGEGCHEWSQAWPLNLDATAPTDPIAAVTSGTYDRSITFTGSAEALSDIRLSVNDATCRVAVAADGIFTCTFENEFEYGAYEAAVAATDKAGNESAVVRVAFSVKELFVAPQIIVEELPLVLEVVPINDMPENKVFQQPISVIDSVNSGDDNAAEDKVLAVAQSLTTEGGIVQASENGWQVLGMPWFVWFGSVSGLFAGWWAFGGPTPRRLGSLLSL